MSPRAATSRRTTATRQLVENTCDSRLVELLQRWLPHGQVNGHFFEAGGLTGGAGCQFRYHLSYGDFHDLATNAAGRGPVELRAAQLGMTPAAAVKVVAHELGIHDLNDQVERMFSASGPDVPTSSEYTPMYPVPEGAPLLDFSTLTAQHWRGLGSGSLVPTRIWTWYDSGNRLLGYTCRFDRAKGGGKFFRRLLWCGPEHGWRFAEFSKPYPVYGAELISQTTERVLIVEGEKACDAARQLFPDLAVVTWPGGSNWAKHTSWRCLRGREVVILPDQDDAGLKAAGDLAMAARKHGALTVEVVDLARYFLPEGWDVADEVPADCDLDIVAEVNRLFGVPENIARLNEDYFVVDDNGKVVIMREVQDQALNNRRKINRYSFADFRNFFCDEEVVVGQDLKGLPITKTLGEHWITHPRRRKYHDITCDPRGAPPEIYNLWKGFAVEAVPGDWSLLQDHILHNVASGDPKVETYVLNWLAFMVQRPADPVGVALALRGRKGTGKGMLFRAAGYLFGQHFLHISNSKHLTGSFNAHLRDAVAVFADEAFWAGDKQGESTLKTLVTEPTLIVEGKGRDAITSRNMVHLMIASNLDWVVPASADERRFCVLDMGTRNMQDAAYFKAILRQLEDGGYEAMLHDLLTRDISDFNPANVPMSQALFDQKIDSLDNLGLWWYHRLTTANSLEFREGWAARVPMMELYKDCTDFLQRLGRRDMRLTPAAFSKRLRRLASDVEVVTGTYIPVVPGLAQDLSTGRPVSGKVFVMPHLAAARAEFEQAMDFKVDWEDTQVL